MGYRIREWQSDVGRDIEYFASTVFATEMENGLIRLDRPEAELRQEHRRELFQFVAGKPRTGIWIAETTQCQYAGLLWVSVSENRELWDFLPSPAWIYDVRVEPAFRRQGLGQRLLLEADAWARRNGFDRIGLHVFGHNEGAFHLYRSTGYGVRNCYLQKALAPDGSITPPATPFRIRTQRTRDDWARCLALGYQHYRELVLADQSVSEQALRERYEAFIAKADDDKPHHRAWIADGEGEAPAGYAWAYVSQGDLGSKRYVWTQDIVVSPESRGQGLEQQLVAYVERWTRAQGLDTVRMGLHSRDLAAQPWLRSAAGYVVTNYFMEKHLQERTGAV